MMKQFWKQLIAAMIIVCNCLPAQTQVLITPQVPPYRSYQERTVVEYCTGQ